MEITRTIIAVKEDGQDGPIGFPRVCAWKQPNGAFSVTGLRDAFPVGGNVFVHKDRIGGHLPERDAYGVFQCIESLNNKSAHWSISSAGNDLCEVIRLPLEVTSLRALSEWIESPYNGKLHRTFQGTNEIYLFNRTLGLVGPVVLDSSKYFRPLLPAKLYAHVNVATVVGGPAFILKKDLLQGETVQISKADAVKTLVHRLWKQGKFDWLTRDNNRELANAVLEFNDLPGVAWVKEDLKKALESLATIEPIKEEACQVLLEDPRIASALETKWKERNLDAQSELDKTIKKVANLNSEAEERASSLREIQTEVQRKIEESNQLEGQIEQGREKARKAFEDEIEKLIANPAQVAALKSLLGGPVEMGKQSHFRSIQVHCDQVSESLQQALQENLHDCGLATECAREIACVVTSAVRSGQPVSLLGNNADYLADAMAAAFTNAKFGALDTPAGLLSPLNWPEELINGTTPSLVIRSINRSAIDIVLGDLKEVILAQANQAQSTKTAIFMSLLPFDRFSVGQIPFLGPIIDEKFLEFKPGATSKPHSYTSQIVGKAGFTEINDLIEAFRGLEEEVEETFPGLSLKHLCTALGTLGTIGFSNSQAEQALFKFWLLPRFKEANAPNWIERCENWISKDSRLKAYYQRYVDLHNPTGE